jgi:hypothetical protein
MHGIEKGYVVFTPGGKVIKSEGTMERVGE